MPNRKDPQSISEAARLFFRLADPEGLGRMAGKGSSGSDWQVTRQGTMVNRKTGEEKVLDEFQRQKQAEWDWREKQANRAMQARAAQFQALQGVKQQQAQRVPESSYQKAAAKQAELANVDKLLSKYDEYTGQGGEVQEPIAGLPSAGLRSAGFHGAANLWENVFDEEEAITMRSDIEGLVGPYRKHIMGTAQTGSEEANWQKANPLANGITQSEQRKRLQRLRDWYDTGAQAIMGGRQPPPGVRPQPNLSGDNMPQGPASVRAANTSPVPDELSDEELTRQYEAVQRWNAQGAR